MDIFAEVICSPIWHYSSTHGSSVCGAHDVWIQLYLLMSNLQAVVVSIDPRRVYVKDPNDVQLKTIRVSSQGEVLSFDLLLFVLHT